MATVCRACCTRLHWSCALSAELGLCLGPSQIGSAGCTLSVTPRQHDRLCRCAHAACVHCRHSAHVQVFVTAVRQLFGDYTLRWTIERKFDDFVALRSKAVPAFRFNRFHRKSRRGNRQDDSVDSRYAWILL